MLSLPGATTTETGPPGSIRDELDFNDRICMDEFDCTNKDGTQFRVFHVVDWATNFQCARIAPDRSSSAIIQTLADMWFAWAGSPSEVIVDAGSEFNSEEFFHIRPSSQHQTVDDQP